jgi:hypothetical protein
MLIAPEDVSWRIRAGECLLLAGEEELLRSLPPGNWIGGTTSYFMAETGGVVTGDKLFVSPLPADIVDPRIASYDAASLPGICRDIPEDGVCFLILPGGSEVHLAFAQEAADYDQMFRRPLMGWIAGVHLDDLGWKTAKVVDGRTGSVHADQGIALHGRLVPGKSAHLGIVNLFKPGNGDTLTFPQVGFQVDDCYVNGRRRNFASYLREKDVDLRNPLVDVCSGSNVSFQAIDSEKSTVSLYAPVFPGAEYRVAEPVADYVDAFRSAVPQGLRTDFSCNCILNFLHSSLEGKVTAGVTGPVTFGEIAYHLLNQTLVYLSIEEAGSSSGVF